MKKIYPVLLFAIITLASCQTKKANPADDVKSITIKYTDLGRQTMFRITCESFDKYFPKPMVTNVISKAGIDTMMRVIGDMKVIDNDQEPDVRSKIYITHKNNKIDTVCVGTSVIKYRQLTYETPQKLLMIIQQ
jgi:PBP1b-binding outer membrane lipoprotein LpoB